MPVLPYSGLQKILPHPVLMTDAPTTAVHTSAPIHTTPTQTPAPSVVLHTAAPAAAIATSTPTLADPVTILPRPILMTDAPTTAVHTSAPIFIQPRRTTVPTISRTETNSSVIFTNAPVTSPTLLPCYDGFKLKMNQIPKYVCPGRKFTIIIGIRSSANNVVNDTALFIYLPNELEVLDLKTAVKWPRVVPNHDGRKLAMRPLKFCEKGFFRCRMKLRRRSNSTTGQHIRMPVVFMTPIAGNYTLHTVFELNAGSHKA